MKLNARYPTATAFRCKLERGAFTLIELLVVIAIISILAAILFPVFSAAREKARQATCESNLKQIGIAMMQYVQDYDEYFPGDTDNQMGVSDVGTGHINTLMLLDPYIKSVNVWACPSNPFSTYEINYGSSYSDKASYADNCELFYKGYGAPHTQNFIVEPANKLMITETIAAAGSNNPANSWYNGAGSFDLGFYYDSQVPTHSTDSAYSFYANGFAGHTGLMNVLFCDAHVKAENPALTAGANGTVNQWGMFQDSPVDSTCPSNSANNPNSLNCDGYSPGATTNLGLLEARYAKGLPNFN